jgi:hypothetical protein
LYQIDAGYWRLPWRFRTEESVNIRMLFILTALVEAGTGMALLLSPSLVPQIVLGTALDGAAAPVVARLAGAALLAIGVACWLARDDAPGRAARGLLAAVLLYNVCAAAVLAHAGAVSGLTGIGLWPATAIHAAMAVWCVVCFRAIRG